MCVVNFCEASSTVVNEYAAFEQYTFIIKAANEEQKILAYIGLGLMHQDRKPYRGSSDCEK